LRFRPWLFVVGGALPAETRWRETLTEELPAYLRNQVASWGPDETVFAYFLMKLRETGRTEDPRLPAALAGSCLGFTARRLGEAAAHLPARPDVALLATNGHLLLATRLGRTPLYYMLLEGSGHCPRHGLDAGKPKEADPLTLQHRRCRTIAVSSQPTRPGGWKELLPGQVLAADEKLNVHTLSVAA
jgi:glutamine amidotransferase